ncbi:MAG TPA: hypothetical protein VKK79_21315, partial [Candidatus Lokiarchaeia archaeon]|nr:hypothetical protein [Candidatus Lokiarchaeia archaeon]
SSGQNANSRSFFYKRITIICYDDALLKQINFRLTEEEYEVIQQIAAILEKSIPTLLKELSLKELTDVRKKIALNLYEQKKIGLKRAWKLSGLSFYEFQQAIIAANIEPNIPEELVDKMIAGALSLRKEDLFPKGISKEESSSDES